ncbi:MAG: TetR/AcrR family transcriptional regulator [Acidimicrobiales bacterium]
MHTAVLKATVDILYESGFDKLTIREIAERAEVNESSIYRRWRTKADLVVDALLGRLGQEVPTPDTGSLREDLLVSLRAVRAFLATPFGENLVRLALRNDLPILDAARHKFWTDRFTRGSAMLDRAEARGELRPEIDRFLTIETLIGPVYFRFLLTREPLDEGVLETVVDLLLAGIAVEPPPALRPTPRCS